MTYTEDSDNQSFQQTQAEFMHVYVAKMTTIMMFIGRKV